MRLWRRPAGGRLAAQLLRLFCSLPLLFVFTLNFALVCEHHKTSGGLLRLATGEPATASRAAPRTLLRADEEGARQQQQQQQPVIANDNKGMKPAISKNRQQAGRVKATTNAQQTGGQQEPERPASKPGRTQKGAAQAGTGAGQKRKSADLWRASKSSRRLHQDDSLPAEGGESRQQASGSEEPQEEAGGLQVSITPRVRQVRVPIESNAILKCLISLQASKFTKPFKVSWSRYRQGENDYEQIESESYESDSGAPSSVSAGQRAPERAKRGAREARLRRDDEVQLASERISSAGVSGNSSSPADSQPLPVTMINRQQELRDFLARSHQETNVISELLVEAVLAISPVKASDNASYFCTATQGRGSSEPEAELQQQQRAQIDLLPLWKPEVRLERVQPARDSKSALVFWSIVSDGNMPIYKTILMVRNDSQRLDLRPEHQYKFQEQQQHATQEQSQQEENSQQQQQQRSSLVLDGDHNQWQRIEIPADGGLPSEELDHRRRKPAPAPSYPDNGLPEDSVVRADLEVTSINDFQDSSQFAGSGAASQAARQRSRDPRRSYNLTRLLPGVTYQLRLAALNDMGQSEWSHMVATMPNEIPAQISELRVLSATNDSLTIGWRRPPYDAARTIRYEMQLFDLNRTMTLDANTNTNSSAQQTQRSAFMFHFVSLQPGTDYHFHIRACSRAGCSAYSTPKLAASTLDGEPDEPLDVELSCDSVGGQLQVTWLPPLQPRGRLLNYTVALEAESSYRNHSGHWVNEQRQTRLDTGDNHTLSVDFASSQHEQRAAGADGQLAQLRLVPNTNYTARVCANNRSPRCGRWSQAGSKARCATPAELPRELPANMRLSFKQLKLIDVEQMKPEAETLVLELPFISSRNGSIDCIQVILIRLPSSFDTARRALSEFLPDDPAEIKLHEYLEWVNSSEPDDQEQQQADKASSRDVSNSLKESQHALAYLAEELDSANQAGSTEELASGAKQILLGDGVQSSCAQVWAQVGQQEVEEGERKSVEAHKKSAVEREEGMKRAMRAIDGPLIAQTHYTGFLRLVQLKFDRRRQTSALDGMRRRSAAHVEVLTKYSNYFSPVKTGQQVPEVSLESLLANDRQLSNYASGGELASGANRELEERFCDSKLIASIQNKLGTDRPCKMAVNVASSIKRVSVSSYKRVAGFVAEHLRVESLTRLFSSSSPPLQLLEMGLLVFVVSCFLLLLIYLFTLPAAMRRRGKRQEIKRQLQEHEASALGGGGLGEKSPKGDRMDEAAGFAVQQCQANEADGNGHKSGQQLVQPDLQALASSLGYQQVPELTNGNDHGQLSQHSYVAAYGTLARPKECPIHSSPMSQVVSHHEAHQQQQHASDMGRRQSVHVCQRGGEMSGEEQEHADYADHTHNHYQQEQQLQLQRHHHHHHHRSTYHIHQEEPAEQTMADWNEPRNCRTMRRSQQQQPINGLAGDSVQSGHYNHYGQQHADQFAVYSQQRHPPLPQANYTMTMQHDTVFTLAKKINKSLPLSLFQSVLEYRLKNGWLREEYEQLPRVANIQMHPAINKINEDGKHVKLRPQLIVSRDDSVSALISGNKNYDGSLIKLQLPAAGSGANGAHMIEKQFICAKSPTDADSVRDFWRLIYEQEVSSLVMLTPNEDTHTGELRCAQYWPTCDNEETTILSPCNEYVQQSSILPAKFKIRQETLSGFEMDGEQEVRSEEFKIRRLTLLVMATKPNENDHTNATTPTNDDTSKLNAANLSETRQTVETAQTDVNGKESTDRKAGGISDGEELNADEEESLVIIERNLLHFQFLHWNASSVSNQIRLIKFIELVNERHSRQMQQQASPGTNWQQITPQNPILVHCANGIGRSGLFTAMSFIIDDLSFKLSTLANTRTSDQQQQQMVAKVNLFHLVSKLRSQRDMLLSPYRFYELLYQLTTRCIPAHHNHHYHDHHKGRDQVSAIANQAPN